MSGVLGRAKEHAADDWKAVKADFFDMYIKQNLTLSEVRMKLKYEKEFDATEKQYKNKIKLWGLHKHPSAAQEYSCTDQLLTQPPSSRLHEFMSKGIPIPDKKIQRYMRRNSQRVSPSTEGNTSLPLDRARFSSAKSTQADSKISHSWSPATADGAIPEPGPDKDHTPSRLVEFLTELQQKERLVANLKEHIRAVEDQIADLRRLIHLETAMPALRSEAFQKFITPPSPIPPARLTFTGEDLAIIRDNSPGQKTHANYRQSTQRQPWPQPYSIHYYTGQEKEPQNRDLVPLPQATTATATPRPASEPDVLAWRTVHVRGSLPQPYQPSNAFEDAFRAPVESNRVTELAASTESIDGSSGPKGAGKPGCLPHRYASFPYATVDGQDGAPSHNPCSDPMRHPSPPIPQSS